MVELFIHMVLLEHSSELFHERRMYLILQQIISIDMDVYPLRISDLVW